MIDFVIDDEGDYESSMTGSDRRQEILKNIKESDRPVSGSKLAKDYDVSRQVIVQDIALLRASGMISYQQTGDMCWKGRLAPREFLKYVIQTSSLRRNFVLLSILAVK